LAGAPNVAAAPARRLSAASPQTAPHRSTLIARRSDSAVADVWNFANKHRAVVNALVRSQPSLLDETDGSLRVLLEKPRLIDFDNKVAHIRARLKRLAEDPRARAHGATRVTINRKQVLTDSFARLQYLRPSEVRGRVMIEFAGEEGIDAGGLTREWYVLMAREMFNPDAALFELSPSGDGSYQPYKNSGVNELHLSYFRFIGRVIGKAVFDGYLVDAHFTRPFYKHLLGIPLNYDDMEAFDPEFHKSLSFMLEHPLAASGLDHLTFSETKNYFGVETDVELIPDGANVAVTDENKLEYVNLVAAHRMTDSIRDQIAAFSRGFNEIVPHDVVRILNPSELELLISGTPSIDVADLKNNTEYQGYSASAPQVRWFWEVVEDLTEEDRARLLMFVTGTSKVPLDGFKALQGISGPQKFQIHRAYGAESGRLCSAHTCFNQLDLPEYATKEELRDRLMFAISEGSEGFGFG
jgi:E3 ubiquitin-protein ligase HUWE1